MGNDLDLSLALLADLDGIAEVTGAALDLDAVVQELLKRLDVEDLVVDGLRAVDDELLRHLLALLGGGCVALLYFTNKFFVLSLLFSEHMARHQNHHQRRVESEMRSCVPPVECVAPGKQQSGCTYGGRHF